MRMLALQVEESAIRTQLSGRIGSIRMYEDADFRARSRERDEDLIHPDFVTVIVAVDEADTRPCGWRSPGGRSDR